MYKLHEYIDDKFFEDNPYGLVRDERVENVIVLNFTSEFKNKKPKVSFDNVTLAKFSAKSNNMKFFFEVPKANKTPDFPSVLIKYADIKENLSFFKDEKEKSKIIKVLNKYKKDSKLGELRESFLSNSEDIRTAVENSMEGRNNDNDEYLLSLSVDGKCIGESDFFIEIRQKIKENLLARFFTLKNKVFKEFDKHCSVCLSKNKEIWGYVSTFNFYTAKTEFAPISGGFNKEKAWKNYPVCPDCAAKLEEVKAIIENYMNYDFCGFSYYLIPEFVISHPDNTEIMDYFLDKETALGKFSLSEQTRNSITNSNTDILDIIKDSNNHVNYSMLFYKKNKDEFKILMNIEDVYPSQFKQIFDAKAKSEKVNIFKNFKFKFELIKNITGKFELSKNSLKNEHRFNRTFLEIVRCVFIQKKIDYSFLMKRIAENLGVVFSNTKSLDNQQRMNSIDYFVIKIFLSLNFFNNLNIINLSLNNKEDKLESEYNDFFNEHKDFFNNPAKKAVFLEGVLCQKLLNIQYNKREAAPFRNKLNGLKLSPKLIKKLFPEIISKLEQYDSNYYKKLEETISKLFLDSNIDDMSNDEISFYFAMGMTLHKEIIHKEIINNESEKNNNSKTE
jgi:CRISPR-associated protein Csh1